MKEDLYLWLSQVTTTRPLLEQWHVPGAKYVDPVEELYKDQKNNNTISEYITSS